MLLEAFHRLQPIDLALIGGDLRCGGVEARDGAVVVGFLALLFLYGNDPFGRVPPTLIGRLGELLFGFSHLDVGAGRIQLALCSGELRIEIRGFDRGEDIALFHVRAVIEVPVFEISWDAGIDWCFIPSLNGAR